MRKKTTIFSQLIFNVVVPALVALVILGAINYMNLRKALVNGSVEKNNMLVDQVKYILEFRDMTLDILESTLDNRMSGYSNILRDMYFADTRDIEKANLNTIREEVGMDPQNEDLYIINTNGIIVNTTFEKDRGLNLFSFGEEHKNYLQHVFNGKVFVNERFADESTTHRLKKYSYQPTLDGKYIIEMGVYSKKADEIIALIRTRLDSLSEEKGTIKAVELFIITDEPFSLGDGKKLSNEEKPIVDTVVKNQGHLIIRKEIDGHTLDYDYFFMGRKNSSLYKGSVIKIVADRSNDIRLLRNELIKLFIIFAIAILIVVFMVYQKTKVITSPIQKLVESVNRITHGHLNERAEVIGHNEISTLSEQFNMMIQELESLYNDLEQKVRDRTAEIMHQKEEIETQRDAIELQKNLLEETNQNLEAANHEVSEQKKHITDSIIYAKRIQNAILPPDDQIKRLLRDSFIFYHPKDIVSGDFYWLTEIDGLVMVAAVDCTGHGVPGAFMSIVGHNNLNHAVNFMGARSAGEILTELNQGVTATLRQQKGHETIRDGMDLALCCIDFDNRKLLYAGANNPMVMIRGNESILYEATKAPIGAYVGEKLTEFKENIIDLQTSDCFYIFSDGFADQFGGPDNKKFLKRHLRELLLEISPLPMEEQKMRLEIAFNEWKGNNEQVDDILIIGIRV